ncbi:MAG: hypothetical protein LBF23_03890, partial [Endomicrobium sp.]|nr:hypothetical protein [Endomicrobium sp.]
NVDCLEKENIVTSKEQARDEVTSSLDLINVWAEIVEEVIKKHPLTAQPLRKAFVKILGDSSIQLSVPSQFDYESLLEFREQISKFFKRKTGVEVLIKIALEKNDNNACNVGIEEIVITPQESFKNKEYVVKEDFKETSKTAIPKHIEEIAKKFGSTAKKI